jgi:hypothetical protein
MCILWNMDELIDALRPSLSAREPESRFECWVRDLLCQLRVEGLKKARVHHDSSRIRSVWSLWKEFLGRSVIAIPSPLARCAANPTKSLIPRSLNVLVYISTAELALSNPFFPTLIPGRHLSHVITEFSKGVPHAKYAPICTKAQT